MPGLLGGRPARRRARGGRGAGAGRARAVRWTGVGLRGRRPGGPRRAPRARDPGARHLLRHAGDGSGARRRGRAHRRRRVRAHAPAGDLARRSVRRPAGGAVLDEPPRRGRPAARGLRRDGRDRRRAGRGDGVAAAADVRGAVPSRGRPHALRHRPPQGVPVRRVRLHPDLDRGPRDRRAGRAHPGAGRRPARHLRPLRRRRQRRRRAARPPGDRRPADLRVRRSRLHAPQRGRAGRAGVRPPLRGPARARPRPGPVPRAAPWRHRPRGEAQGHRRRVHPHLRGGGRKARRGARSSCRARSTPT